MHPADWSANHFFFIGPKQRSSRTSTFVRSTNSPSPFPSSSSSTHAPSTATTINVGGTFIGGSDAGQWHPAPTATTTFVLELWISHFGKVYLKFLSVLYFLQNYLSLFYYVFSLLFLLLDLVL
jgi:hypothetical protein